MKLFRRSAPAARQEPRMDGWTNMLSGVGTTNDPLEHFQFTGGRNLPPHLIKGLYRSNGFARRVIDVRCNEMVREWVSISGDGGDAILTALTDLKAQSVFENALRQANLFGGAAILPLGDDAGSLASPLKMGRTRRVRGLRIYTAGQTLTPGDDVIEDPLDPDFGLPAFYKIKIGDNETPVHRSRLLFIDGAPVSEAVRAQNGGFGASRYEAIIQELKHLGVAHNSAAQIVRDFSGMVLSVSRLSELLSEPGGEDKVKARLKVLDLARSMINAMILDAGDGQRPAETAQRQSTSVAGLKDLLEQMALNLCAVTGMPATLLMGRSPAGLSATGESDVRFWYDHIASDQERVLRDPLEKLIAWLALSKDGPTGGTEPEWALTFKPLWQLDAVAETGRFKTEMEGLSIGVNAGIIDADSARARFGPDKDGLYNMPVSDADADLDDMTGADVDDSEEPEDGDPDGLSEGD